MLQWVSKGSGSVGGPASLMRMQASGHRRADVAHGDTGAIATDGSTPPYSGRCAQANDTPDDPTGSHSSVRSPPDGAASGSAGVGGVAV
jgi:hypothetical protein